MPSAIIEIKTKYANEGKKLAAFTDASGKRYSVDRLTFGTLQEGGVYDIFWEDKEFQGKPWKHVQTVKPQSSQTAPAVGKVLASAERARTPDAESKQIWVCALLVAAIKAGNVNILEGSDLLTATENAMLARERLMDEKVAKPAPKTNSQAAPNDDMADEVPF